MKTVLCVIFLISLVCSPVIGAESKSDWTHPEAVQFAEDLFYLFETIYEEAVPDVKISLESHPVQDGFRRILEFRFSDDRIISVEIHRDIAGEDTA